MTERDIFLAAVEIENPGQRAAYLDAACLSDNSLRKRVEDLLQSHAGAGSFLRRPAPAQAIACDDATVRSDAGSRAGTPSFAFLDPPTKAGALGRLEHYEVLELVGQGAFGIVFKAFDDQLHRVVAIKVLSPELASNAMARQRFIREARAAAAISHEHVVTIHAVNETRIPPFLVMQYVAGVSLQDKLTLSGPPRLAETLRIASQVASGLAAAHKQGLVHRDIKPANILLENGIERVKITDFGLARAVDDIGITQTGVVAGTPQYMSPEQARGDAIDSRSDLFSLGAVLYTLCTGRAPFRADSTVAVLRRVCDEHPRPIVEINPDVPAWLIEIVDRLLAKDPANRYQTAAEVAETLRSLLVQIQDTPPGVRRQTPVSVATAAQSPAFPTGPAPRPWGIPVLATVNVVFAVMLMFIASMDDPDVLKAAPIWQLWAHVSSAVDYVLATLMFVSSIGLYLWAPWGRRLLMLVCILGLLTLPLEIPYLARSVFPMLAEEVQTDLTHEGMAAPEAALSAKMMVVVLVVPMLVAHLVWLIGSLVYVTRPHVVAAFEPNRPASPPPPSSSGSNSSNTALIVLLVCLMCCCPGSIVLLGLGFFGLAATSVEEATGATEMHESGEHEISIPSDSHVTLPANDAHGHGDEHPDDHGHGEMPAASPRQEGRETGPVMGPVPVDTDAPIDQKH